MNTTGYRVSFTLLAVALLGIIGVSILFIPSGDPDVLPDAVERYTPADGDMVLNPVSVMIDVLPNYKVRLVIDGITIPESQVDSILATGRYEFTPGPAKMIDRWTSGDHTVVATWIGGTAGIDVGTLVWTFTVT